MLPRALDAANEVWKSPVDSLVDNCRTRIAQVHRALWIIVVDVHEGWCLNMKASVGPRHTEPAEHTGSG